MNIMSIRSKYLYGDELLSNSFTLEKEQYVSKQITRICLMGLMDEDYNRAVGVLDRSNPIDLVCQNEYIISLSLKYCA